MLTLLRYYTRESAELCVRHVNATRLDSRIIRVDWDRGFEEGRQYGRGKKGGQVSKHDVISLTAPFSLPLCVLKRLLTSADTRGPKRAC